MILPSMWIDSDNIGVFTDASGRGYGFCVNEFWGFGCFPDSWLSFGIAIKELYPIVVVAWLFGSMFANSKIIFNSDNLAVVEILNKQSAHNKHLMLLLRSLICASMKFNFLFKSAHLAGKLNVTADLLSRFHIKKALDLNPQFLPSAVQVPDFLLPEAFIQ